MTPSATARALKVVSRGVLVTPCSPAGPRGRNSRRYGYIGVFYRNQQWQRVE